MGWLLDMATIGTLATICCGTRHLLRVLELRLGPTNEVVIVTKTDVLDSAHGQPLWVRSLWSSEQTIN